MDDDRLKKICGITDIHLLAIYYGTICDSVFDFIFYANVPFRYIEYALFYGHLFEYKKREESFQAKNKCIEFFEEIFNDLESMYERDVVLKKIVKGAIGAGIVFPSINISNCIHNHDEYGINYAYHVYYYHSFEHIISDEVCNKIEKFAKELLPSVRYESKGPCVHYCMIPNNHRQYIKCACDYLCNMDDVYKFLNEFGLTNETIDKNYFIFIRNINIGVYFNRYSKFAYIILMYIYDEEASLLTDMYINPKLRKIEFKGENTFSDLSSVLNKIYQSESESTKYKLNTVDKFFTEKMFKKEENNINLKNICRYTIRKHCDNFRTITLNSLPLPPILRNYLQ